MSAPLDSTRGAPTTMRGALNVPLLDLQAQFAPLRDDVLAAITRVCDTQRFILGPEVDGLERELETFLGIEHAIGMSSGTDALVAALMAIGVGEGDKVITTPFSFFATAGSVARLGARPVFVDIEPDTFNIDASCLSAAITPKTKAIIPVHLFGQSADLDAVMSVANQASNRSSRMPPRRLARVRDTAVGGFGAMGCFSFFPSKNLGAFGDAGLVTTRDGELATRLRSLRQHGAQMRYHHDTVGGNFRLDALQAAVLRVKLPHLDRWSAQRRSNADRYVQMFGDAGLSGTITLPPRAGYSTHIYNQFVIRVPERDRLRDHLQVNGVGTEVYYPVPLHLQSCFRGLGYRAGDFPAAEAAATQVLALPIYPELSERQQAWVVESIRTFFQ